MKNKKKGFTIVELVIVIAVIAILAAVLIPTFSNVIRKANEASDTALAKNMNTALSVSEIDSNAPTKMEDVLYYLDQNGFKLENLNPTASGNVFLWNKETNRMTYVNKDNNVLYSGDGLASGSKLDVSNKYWLTVKSNSDITARPGLSYYFAKDITDNLTFDKPSSIDTGTYKAGEVSYTYNDKATVNVHGNLASLNVNAANATVNNYSTVNTVTIENVASESYHEYGSVKTLTVKSTAATANIVIENKGFVENLVVSAAPESAKITNKGMIKDVDEPNKITKNDGIIGDETGNFTYAISNYEDLVSFRDKVNGGMTFAGVKVTLNADIDLSGRAWVPVGYDSRDNYKNEGFIYFAGDFDGQNHTISGLSNKGFVPTTTRLDTYGVGSGEQNNYVFGLFGILNNATVKNIKITNVDIAEEDIILDSVGAVAGFAKGNVTIENCTASGSVSGTDGISGIIGRIYSWDAADRVRIANCTSNVNVVAVGNKAAGIAGFVMEKMGKGEAKHEAGWVVIEGCVNNGSVDSNYCSAGVTTTQAMSSHFFDIKNCKNTGKISCSQEKSDPNSSKWAGAIVSFYNYNTGSTLTAQIVGCENTGALSDADWYFNEKGEATKA